MSNRTTQIDSLKRLGKPIYPKGAGYRSVPEIGSHEVSDGFEQAVRNYFSAPAGATVTTDIQGAQEYQIGEYTWDSDPASIEVSVTWWEDHGDAIRPVSRNESFSTLPELWAALS
jgi:hypothetical protein